MHLFLRNKGSVLTGKKRYLWQHQLASVELKIDDKNVVQMISKFHKEVTALEAVNCSVCHFQDHFVET